MFRLDSHSPHPNSFIVGPVCGNSRSRVGELVDHWGDMLVSLPQAERVREAHLRYLTEADVSCTARILKS